MSDNIEKPRQSRGGTDVDVRINPPADQGSSWERLRAFFSGPTKFEVFESEGSSFKERLSAQAGMVAAGITILAGYDKPRVKEVEIHSAHWPADLPPTRIAFLTDLHVGSPFMTVDDLRRVVDQTNALKPDLIILGGDYLNEDDKEPKGESMPANGRYVPAETIAQELSRLHAPFGRFAVIGNHDHYYSFEATRDSFQKAGFTVLDNHVRAATIHGREIPIVGAADEWTRKPRIDPLMRGMRGRPHIVVAHNPVTLHRVHTNPALMLAGHTHGGQVLGNFIRAVTDWPIVKQWVEYNKNDGRLGQWLKDVSEFKGTAGGASVDDKGRVTYVSAGLGTSSVGLRGGSGTEPEISLITLKGKKGGGGPGTPGGGKP